MLNLAEYRKRSAHLADLLPWAALVAPGVVLNKDGSFQRSAGFRGPDLDSATPAELVGASARLNNALRRLGSGWAIFAEARRQPAESYPESRFPDRGFCPRRGRAPGPVRGGGQPPRARMSSPSSGCRRRRKRRGSSPGSTRAAPAAASIRGSCCAASSTAPTASCN